MIIRIDGKRLTDAAGLHAAMSEAFGFPDFYGKNLDALVDCLTHLDDPQAGMSRVHVFRGEVALLVLENVDAKNKSRTAQVNALIDAVAFVNYRRMERGEPPVLALAFDRG